MSYEEGRSITLYSETPLFGHVGITYEAAPLDEWSSRLVAKIVVTATPNVLGRLMPLALPAGDLFMMRKQLLTLKTLAERDALAAGRNGATR